MLQDLAKLAACAAADGSVNDFVATKVLRRAGCLEQLPADADQRITRTEEMHDAVVAFGAACVKPDATVADVVAPIIKAKFFKVDARLQQQFADQTPPPAAPIPRKETETDDARRRRGVRVVQSAMGRTGAVPAAIWRVTPNLPRTRWSRDPLTAVTAVL